MLVWSLFRERCKGCIEEGASEWCVGPYQVSVQGVLPLLNLGLDVGETSKFIGDSTHIQQPAAANFYNKSC